MPASYHLHEQPFAQPGQVFLVTCTTLNRCPFFFDFYTALGLLNCLKETKPEAFTWAYVIMPDHFHWLVQVKEEAKLADQVRFIKNTSTQKIRKLGSPLMSIWQADFHARPLTSEDDLNRVARHLVSNPIRAGLVDSIEDYSFWDATWL